MKSLKLILVYLLLILQPAVAQNITAISTMAALKALPEQAGPQYQAVYLRSYTTTGDGGGGNFVWASSSAATGDDCIVVTPTNSSGNGRWLRQFTGPLNVRWCGMTGNISDDQSAGFARSFTSAIANNLNLYFPKGPGSGGGGAYRLNSVPTLTYSDFLPNFIGDGPGTPGDWDRRGSCLFYGGAAGVPAFLVFTDANTTVAPSISNMCIVQGGAEVGLLNNNNSFFTFQNVVFEGATNSANSAMVELRNSTLSANNTEHNKFFNVRFFDYKGAAIRLTNQTGAANISHNYLTVSAGQFSPQNNSATDIDVGGLNISPGVDVGAAISRSSVEAKTFPPPFGSFVRIRDGSPGIVDTFFAVQGEAATPGLPPNATRIQVDGTSAAEFYLNWWGGINIVAAGNPQYPLLPDSVAADGYKFWTEFPGSGWPNSDPADRPNRVSGSGYTVPQVSVSVSTGATTIAEILGSGMQCTVTGVSGGDSFYDRVFAPAGGNPVYDQGTSSGAPSARTYSRSSANLRALVAAGTYAVSTNCTAQ